MSPYLPPSGSALAELEVPVGFDDDLAGESTRVSNHIRGLLTQIHPALERVLEPKVAHPAVLELLSHCGGPARPGWAMPAAPDWSRSPGRRRPAWPSGWSTRSSPLDAARPSSRARAARSLDKHTGTPTRHRAEVVDRSERDPVCGSAAP